MKLPFIQKLPLTEDTSFVAKTFRTPHFEVSWHQHPEIELILFTEGAGQCFIGNGVGEFETGDIFLLGSNLPHTFQKSGDTIASAVVVQFREDFWGVSFLQLPEIIPVKQLFDTALQGLKITGNTKTNLAVCIRELEFQKGIRRILTLGNCLEMIRESGKWQTLSTLEVRELNPEERQRLDRVFQYSFDNFKEPITLNTIATLASLSVPAFCTYFKKRTKKTYIDFLNEVRIGYACKLLTNSAKDVSEICYESGFNTLTNFHRQFKRLKGTTPHQYKSYMDPAIR
jgi:AraC-like DNA-binding protein/quercetin dioxygenase-like cupin family protein